MLEEMLNNVINATTKKEKERAYKQLERLGMDRMTVNYLVSKIGKSENKN